MRHCINNSRTRMHNSSPKKSSVKHWPLTWNGWIGLSWHTKPLSILYATNWPMKSRNDSLNKTRVDGFLILSTRSEKKSKQRHTKYSVLNLRSRNIRSRCVWQVSFINSSLRSNITDAFNEIQTSRTHKAYEVTKHYGWKCRQLTDCWVTLLVSCHFHSNCISGLRRSKYPILAAAVES